MGSLMIEENVVASAGTVHYLTLDEIKRSIREAGWEPRQRNVFYQLIDERPARVPAHTLRDTSLPVLN
jgi:cyclic dehypoxanthinyl futalosine synthase